MRHAMLNMTGDTRHHSVMKTPNDPRHQKRINRMQQLFSYSFRENVVPEDVSAVIEMLPKIDATIEKSAPEWPVDKIAKIDLAILRLAIWELLFEAKEPPKVIIDEAVELGKTFGNEHSAKFVNGVLGTIVKT